ncbi:thioesterase superfamily protein [Salinisphaera sp. PC39]|uniref:PaaI family thioesterase n=1 Tax=Salinisphaera sp. PC39 TaxID=1304156 RepID=UPI00333F6054
MSTYERIADALARQDYAGMIDAVPYARYLDMRVEPAADGRHYRMPYRDDLIGNMRIPALHGGAVGGFMEQAALFEALISQSQRRIPRVIDFGIDYLRSARAEDLLAACIVVRQGRRVAQVRAEAWQSDPDKPVAAVRAVFLLQDID